MVAYTDILKEFGEDIIDDEVVGGLEALFAYQGFDPTRMLKKMADIDKDGWKDDAKVIIVFALTRGNKMSKAMAKMSEEGQTRLKALKSKYRMKENPEARDDITPTRVAAALPTWTVRAAKALQNSLPMGPDNIKALCGADAPAEICCAAFASLIPTSELTEKQIEQLTHAFYLWQFYFTQLINPKVRGKGKTAVLQTFENAVKAAMNSTSYPDKSRVAFLKKIGIFNKKNEINGNIQAMAAAWEKLE
ncbi:nucleoprotein [Razdan virus]|uniref:Nucleoprotein n=1 Tax=Razdan virus TaxID=1405807 RepID=U5NMT5_9VIRU|nr:nucleoprotein [Razdan virus]AGY30955.1 nucleoprotein [Razdan virus]